MREPDWLEGSRVLITGAAGVFGRALVDRALRMGATVTATGRKPGIGAADLPSDVHVLPADLSVPGECLEVVERAVDRMDGLDVLINNAAVLIRRAFVDLTLEDIESSWALNLRAPLLLMQAARPHLERGRAPAIVNVVSTAGVSGGIAQVSSYAMTKAALIVLTKSVAREFGGRGIRVVCVSPPTMHSQMQAALPDDVRNAVQKLNVLGRPAQPEEAALITLFVASPHASLITGSIVDATAIVY